MELFLGYWSLAVVSLAMAMPFVIMAYGYHQNKKSDEKLRVILNSVIAESQRNFKKDT